MKKRFIIISLASLFLQQPVAAQESPEAVDRQAFHGSLLGLVAGGLVAGPPGAVLGFAGGAMMGDLESQNRQLEETRDEFLADRMSRERVRSQAQQHQAQFQQQRETERNKLHALQQGFSFCLGFRTGSSTIEPKMAAQLDSLAQMLLAFPQFQLQIEAGADQRGSEQFNRALSRERAEAVAKLLVAAGIPRERITTRYQGESTAEYPLHDVEGLAFDRMVQLTLLQGEAS